MSIRRVPLVLVVLLLTLTAAPRIAEPHSAVGGDPGGFTVVSLNLAMRDDVDAIAGELTTLGAGQADVVLLQEVVCDDSGIDVATKLGERLGLSASYESAFAIGAGRRSGLAMLSRYPLHSVSVVPLRQFDLGFRSRTRIALGAVADTAAGPVQLFNVHLDTRLNLKQRIEQLSAVVDQVAAIDGPVIVGGDFNSNDNRWVFHAIPLPFLGRQASGLLRYMQTLGFRSAFGRGRATHDALGMQLDWLFLRGLHAGTGAIVPVKLSDHHALVVSVRRDDAPGPAER